MNRRWVVPAVVVLLALAGPWLAPFNASTPLALPFRPSGDGYWLGTDVLGRDVLSRVLAGGRVLVLQALAATALGSAAGLTIGIGCALSRRRRASSAVMRMVDAFATFPALLLLLLLASGVSGSSAAVAVAVALVSVPFSVRVIHERTARLAATDYVRDAQARGESPAGILWYDILPGLAPAALAETGIRFVAATQLTATAGFLGLGAGAPAANWGRMVRENSTGLTLNPLPVIVPAALLVVLAVGVTLALDRVEVP